MVNHRHIGRWLHMPGMAVVKLFSLDMNKGEAVIQEGQLLNGDVQIRPCRTLLGHSEIRRYFLNHLGVLPATWLPTTRGVKLLEERAARAWLRVRSIELRWCVRVLGMAALVAAASEEGHDGAR